MKAITSLIIPILGAIVFVSCDKETLPNTDEEPTPTPWNGVYNPNDYDEHIHGKWYVDSSIYWSVNNPDFHDTITYGYGNFYQFTTAVTGEHYVTYDWDNSTILDPTYIGDYWVASGVYDPSHLHFTIFGGVDIYIQSMSDTHMDWITYDPHNGGYNDSIHVYLRRE